MVRAIKNSFVFAVEGLWHAFGSELNLKLFGLVYVVSLLVGALVPLDGAQWIALLFSGGMFLTVELINTALERLADAFDDHSKIQDDARYLAIKINKDVAAGASLIAACTWGVILLILFWPFVKHFAV